MYGVLPLPLSHINKPQWRILESIIRCIRVVLRFLLKSLGSAMPKNCAIAIATLTADRSRRKWKTNVVGRNVHAAQNLAVMRGCVTAKT